MDQQPEECAYCKNPLSEKQSITAVCGHPYHLQCFVIMQWLSFEHTEPFECLICDRDLTLLTNDAIQEAMDDLSTDTESEDIQQPEIRSHKQLNLSPKEKFDSLRNTSKTFKNELKDLKRLKSINNNDERVCYKMTKEKAGEYKAAVKSLIELIRLKKQNCKSSITTHLSYKVMCQSRKKLITKLNTIAKKYDIRTYILKRYIKMRTYRRSYSLIISRALRLYTYSI